MTGRVRSPMRIRSTSRQPLTGGCGTAPVRETGFESDENCLHHLVPEVAIAPERPVRGRSPVLMVTASVQDLAARPNSDATPLPHGYPLHVDATCDKGRGGLCLCIDGWRGWVLHAARIRSESAAEMGAAIATALALFGDPVAFMRDLGSAAAKAVADCRPPHIPDLVCHFLAALGRKLHKADHAALGRSLAHFRVRSGPARLASLAAAAALGTAADRDRDLPALLLWVLEGDGHKKPAFPFGPPHWDFLRRCCSSRSWPASSCPLHRSRCERSILRQAAYVLEPALEPSTRARLFHILGNPRGRTYDTSGRLLDRHGPSMGADRGLAHASCLAAVSMASGLGSKRSQWDNRNPTPLVRPLPRLNSRRTRARITGPP